MGEKLTKGEAVVWIGGGRRYLTRKAAERAVCRAAIKAFARATGNDGMETDTFQELVAYLLPTAQRGEEVTIEQVDEFFNPSAGREALALSAGDEKTGASLGSGAGTGPIATTSDGL